MISMRWAMMVMAVMGATLGGGTTSADPAPDRLDVPADGVIGGQIEGRAARWLVRADSTPLPLLNHDTPARFGLRQGWFGVGVEIKVGSVPVRGVSRVFSFQAGGVTRQRRGAWFERDIAPGVDGALGPGSLSQDVIVFHMRAPAASERTTVLPLVDRGWLGMGTQVATPDGDVLVQFDPLRPRSVITAAGGAALAKVHHGALDGPLRQELMWFGITRPVRAMHLADPLDLGGLRIADLDVRTTDQGSAGAIPEANASPDEINVVASSKSHARVYRTLHLGADALASCSAITIDRRRRVLILQCR